MKEGRDNSRLISKLFFRLLPIQILILAVGVINAIISSFYSVDIRVVHKNEDMILRIKDDCIPFNPEERQSIMDPKDRMKGVGIRIVYQAAKDIQYQNMLGLNVLTIRI